MTIENLYTYIHIETWRYSLFVLGFTSHSRIFTHSGSNFDLIYSLSSEASRAWNTYKYTGYSISEDPDTHTCSRAFGSGAVITVLRLRSVAAGIRTPNLTLAGRMLLPPTLPRRLYTIYKNNYSAMA